MKKVLHLTQDEIRDLVIEALEARASQHGIPVYVTFVTEQDGTVGAFVENMVEHVEEARPNIEVVHGDESGPTKVGAKMRGQAQGIHHRRLRDVVEQVLTREGLEGDVGDITDIVIDILTDHQEVAWKGHVERGAFFKALQPRVEDALLELATQHKAKLMTEDADEPGPYWTAQGLPHRQLRDVKVVGEWQGRPAIVQRDTIDVVSGEELPKGATCFWFQDLGVTRTHPDKWPEDLRAKYNPDPALFPSTNVAADILDGDGGVMDRSDALEEAIGDGRAPTRAKPARHKVQRRK